MGYYIFSKAIDIDQIIKVFGSKDDVLYSNIEKRLNDDSSYKSIEKGLSIEQAIHAIIYAEPYNVDLGYIYSYGFIEICQYLGKDVPYQQELKLGVETDLFNEYLKQDFDINLIIEDYLFVDGDIDFLNLPKVEDWPVIGILQKERIEKLYNILKPIKIDQDLIDGLWDSDEEEDEDKACAYEAINGLKSNLKFCIDNKLSLAVFCH